MGWGWGESAPVDREQESESGDRLLTARELVHVSEALHRRHGMVLDSCKVGFLEGTTKRPNRQASE
jgi:hypothetical protein